MQLLQPRIINKPILLLHWSRSRSLISFSLSHFCGSLQWHFLNIGGDKSTSVPPPNYLEGTIPHCPPSKSSPQCLALFYRCSCVQCCPVPIAHMAHYDQMYRRKCSPIIIIQDKISNSVLSWHQVHTRVTRLVRVPVDPPQNRSAKGQSTPCLPQERSFRPGFWDVPPRCNSGLSNKRSVKNFS